MRKMVADQNFSHVKHVGERISFQDLSLSRCTFSSCTLGQGAGLETPTHVRNVDCTECTFDSCSGLGILFDSVTLTDINIAGHPLSLSGCLFRHVTLQGKQGTWVLKKLSPHAADSTTANSLELTHKFYQKGDWALDTSRAQFSETAVFDLPGDLVLRDNATQFIITKTKASEFDDRESLPDLADLVIRKAARSQFDSIVVVAGGDASELAEDLEVLQKLVDLGIAA